MSFLYLSHLWPKDPSDQLYFLNYPDSPSVVTPREGFTKIAVGTIPSRVVS